ncbi:aldo/keto reductase [Streptomyces chartreusis]|uniref:aldo/keto reductase n=1 Tax=Streptomyces chartreusis TaxID=1969 RepID=UPI0037FB3247
MKAPWNSSLKPANTPTSSPWKAFTTSPTAPAKPPSNTPKNTTFAFNPWIPLGHGDLVAPTSALSEIAKKTGATPAQIGLAWLLHHSPNTLFIPGTTSINYLEGNINAANLTLDAVQWTEIEERCSKETSWRPTAHATA